MVLRIQSILNLGRVGDSLRLIQGIQHQALRVLRPHPSPQAIQVIQAYPGRQHLPLDPETSNFNLSKHDKTNT